MSSPSFGSVSMSMKTFKEVAAALPPHISVLLRAPHGLGKSSVVRQVAGVFREKYRSEGLIAVKDGSTITLDRVALGEEDFYPVIDRRLSQITEGDMVGLPSIDDGSTRFNPPDWYMAAARRPVVLFLDEINRATPEVMQAAFQIVLDRELGGVRLHPGTRVFAAINTGSQYTVNEMDPALLDRFFVVDLEPSVEEFLDWAGGEGGLHHFIPGFIRSTKRHDGTSWLYPPKGADPGEVHPSPRSWEMVCSALRYSGVIDQPGSDLFYHLTRGFVGNEAAIAFHDFCKTAGRRFGGEDIIVGWDKTSAEEKVRALSINELNELIERVTTYVLEQYPRGLPDKCGANLRKFMEALPDELRISLWSKLSSGGAAKLALVKSVHKHCVDLVLGVFGVPVGEAGWGVLPNTPPHKKGK